MESSQALQNTKRHREVRKQRRRTRLRLCGLIPLLGLATTSILHAVAIATTPLLPSRGGCLTTFVQPPGKTVQSFQVEAALKIDGEWIAVQIPADLKRSIDHAIAAPSMRSLDRLAARLVERTWYDPLFAVRQQFSQNVVKVAPIALGQGDPEPIAQSIVDFSALQISFIDVALVDAELKRVVASATVNRKAIR